LKRSSWPICKYIPEIIPHLEGLPVYVIGIEMEILEDGKEFDAAIIDAIRAKTGI